MSKYTLVNPIIEGSFKTEYSGKNKMEVAEKLWMNLSKYLVGGVPRFMFTLKDNKKSYHTFEVNEDESSGKYTIREKKLDDITGDDFENFENAVHKYSKKANKQNGGMQKPTRKRYESDDSDSDSDSDNMNTLISEYYPIIRRTSPIVYFHYNTRLYHIKDDCCKVNTLNPEVRILRRPIFAPIFIRRIRPIVALY